MATALIVACKLINEDAIPALLPLVLKLLGHNEASIRKKAIMTIQRFYELNESCITDTPEKVCIHFFSSARWTVLWHAYINHDALCFFFFC